LAPELEDMVAHYGNKRLILEKQSLILELQRLKMELQRFNLEL
jgi:hypothetical protein